MRGNRPIGIVPGCVAIACVGLLFITLNVLQGGNEIVIGITGLIFLTFASYIMIVWFLGVFKGRG